MVSRGQFKTAATSKMERFVIIVNRWKALTIITKRSISDVAAVLDPYLVSNIETEIYSVKILFKLILIHFFPIIHFFTP